MFLSKDRQTNFELHTIRLPSIINGKRLLEKVKEHKVGATYFARWILADRVVKSAEGVGGIPAASDFQRRL